MKDGYMLEYGITVCGRKDQFSRKYGRDHVLDVENKLRYFPKHVFDFILNDRYSHQRILKNIYKLRKEAELSALKFVIKYRHQ